MQRALVGGLVIAGGGALLPGICDVAERVLDCPARIGLPKGSRIGQNWMIHPGPRRPDSRCMRRARSQVDLERQSVGCWDGFCGSCKLAEGKMDDRH